MIITGIRTDLEEKGAELLAAAVRDLLKKQPFVAVAVPGGRSVGNVLRRLTVKPVDWRKVQFFMVDERLVPPDHTESNYRLVADCLKPIAGQCTVNPFLYTPSNPTEGVKRYISLLKRYGGIFDITLLASGEDGHVAGLFPDHETIRSKESFFVLTQSAPKKPPARMTSSKRLITRSQVAMLLFFGKEKQTAYLTYRSRSATLEQCPAKIVDTIAQRFILTDQDDGSL